MKEEKIGDSRKKKFFMKNGFFIALALGLVAVGGAVFTLADFAFAVAANRDGREVVTQAAQATFLEAARGGRLIAEARRVRDGGSTCFYEVSVADELGTKVAFVTVNGFVVKK